MPQSPVTTEAFTPIRVKRVTAYPLAAAVAETPQMSLAAMAQRQGLIVCIEDADGTPGWGEVWCNFPPRGMLYKRDLVEQVFAPALRDRSFADPADAFRHLERTFARYALHVGEPGPFAHCIAGLDLALWDLSLRRADLSAAAFFGLTGTARPYASSINAAAVPGLLPELVAAGYREFKIKVGFDHMTDHRAIHAARSILDQTCPDGRLMIDANQAWSVAEAEQRINEFAAHGVAFVEEPIACDSPVADWRRLADAVAVPLAAGENIYGAAAFADHVHDGGVTYVQPDVAKWGGLTGALDLIDRLGERARHLWPHCMGTAIAQAASLVVAALASPDSRAEMDVNANPLRTELVDADLTLRSPDGLAFSTRPGLTPEPDSGRLRRFEVA